MSMAAWFASSAGVLEALMRHVTQSVDINIAERGAPNLNAADQSFDLVIHSIAARRR
jgi:hypothetical protein